MNNTKNILCLFILFISFLNINISGAKGSKKVYKVGCKIDTKPFSFYVDGEPSGYSIDIMKEILKDADLKYEFVKCVSLKDAINKLKSKEIDILPNVPIYNGLDSLLEFGYSYYYNDFYIVEKKNKKGNILVKSKVLYVDSLYIAILNIIKKTNSNKIVKSMPLEKSLKNIKNGNLDFIVTNLDRFHTALEKSDCVFEDFKLTSISFVPLEASYAVRYGNRSLLYKLNNSFSHVRENKVLKQSKEKWLFTLDQLYVKQNRGEFMLVIIIVILILAISSFYLYYKLIKVRNKRKNHKRLLSFVLRYSPYSIKLIDPLDDFKIIYQNKASLKIFKDEFESNIKIENKKLLRQTNEYIFKEGKDFSGNENFFLIDGKQIETKVVKKLVYNANKPLIFIVRTIINEYVDAKNNAEVSENLKSVFLANMSHDLRVPLNAILGFSGLLTDAESVEEKKKYSEIIVQNKDYLLSMIDDVVDLSSIQNGEMKFDDSLVNLSNLLEEVKPTIYKMIEDSGKDLKLKFENPFKYCDLYIDKEKYLRVAFNFITNAIKYSKKGQISIGFFETEDGMFGQYVLDNGVGMSEENSKQIFKPYKRIDNNFENGTGLGMTISKAIIDSVDGKIGVVSKEGVGSIFWCCENVKRKVEFDENYDMSEIDSVKEKIKNNKY